MLQNLLAKLKGIILKPQDTWNSIKTEDISNQDLFKNFAVIMAAVPALAKFIGLSFVGVSVPIIGSIRIGVGTGLGHAFVSYLLALAGTYLFALIINYLAPNFGSQKNFNNALKVAVFTMFPAWAIGLLNIFPSLTFIVLLLSLYSLYVLFVGQPILMDTPKEKSAGYVVTSIIAMIVVYIIIGVILSSMFSTSMGASALEESGLGETMKNLDKFKDLMEK